MSKNTKNDSDFIFCNNTYGVGVLFQSNRICGLLLGCLSGFGWLSNTCPNMNHSLKRNALIGGSGDAISAYQ